MEHSAEHVAMPQAGDIAARHFSVLRANLGDKVEQCEQHGEFASSGVRYNGRREIWTKCPDCEEARIAEERQAEAQRRADQARARLEAMIEQSFIPNRFIGRSFDNFRAETQAQVDALAAAREFAESFADRLKRGNGLIFSGLPGTGKSHLAAAILQAIMPGHCGLYVTCMGAIRAVRGTWRKDSERSESQVLNAFAEVPLLVIDEVGVQYGTDGEQTIIFDILDRRYRDMSPTIILTNQSKKGLKDFIGDRSFDRLVETSRWVAFDWESYRPQAKRDAA